MIASIPVAKCEQCAFMHMRKDANAHCYMFKCKPGNFCAQYKSNIRDAGSVFGGGRRTGRETHP